MKADLSRGHRPDDKRDQRYRRVLTQQGRLWLDSDVAASVDATDRLLRHLTKDVGCPAGSPDTGYLASPGRAFAWFDSLDHVEGLPDDADPFRAFRDYAVKYMERFPSLYLDARVATGPITITGRYAIDVVADGKLRLWMKRAPGADPLPLTVNGTPVPMPAAIPGGFGFDAYDYDLGLAGVVGTPDEIVVGFAAPGAANEAWIGFIEDFNPATQNPLFWITEGRYYIDGLEVAHAEASSQTFVDPATFLPVFGPLASETRFVAYLEGWERLVTHVEDPGLRDSALGGLDTTVRTRAMGQVKIAVLPASALPFDELVAQIEAAFGAVNRGLGTLDVAAAASPPNPDPCAIPIEGGYNADENRLYRFEIHVGGNLGTARVKWSRNNGSELFAVEVDVPALGTVKVQETPGTAPPMRLLENDIVEVLNEAIDLGDAARASVDLVVPDVRPSVRRVGRLCTVKNTAVDGVVQLCVLGTSTPVDFGAASEPVPTRIRKWDGIIQSVAAPSVHVIEDGLELTLGGSDFRVGDYWQFEARRLGTNAASPPVIVPHGPERLLAPLALFQVAPTAPVPVELEHWFDDRFRPICELRADDIWYDGTGSGTDADTVQEAIDELYVLVKEKGGCCDFTLKPLAVPGDDSARIQTIIDGAAPKKKICLARGVYRLQKPLVIDQKDVTIEGCPEAIIEGEMPDGPMFLLAESPRLTLENLVIRGRGDRAVIEMKARPTAGAPQNEVHVAIRRSKVVQVEGGDVIADEGTPVPAFQLGTDAVVPSPAAASDNVLSLEAERVLLAGRFGLLVHQVRSVDVRDSVIRVERGGVAATFGGFKGQGLSLLRVQMSCSLGAASLATLAAATSSTIEQTIEDVVVFENGSVSESVAIAGANLAVELRSTNVLAACAVGLERGRLFVEDGALGGEEAQAVWLGEGPMRSVNAEFVSGRLPAVHVTRPHEIEIHGGAMHGQVGFVCLVGTDLKTPLVVDETPTVAITDTSFQITDSAAGVKGGVLAGPVLVPQPTTVDNGTVVKTVLLTLTRIAIDLKAAPDDFAFGILVNLETSPLLSSATVTGSRVTGQSTHGILVARGTARLEANQIDLVLAGVQQMLTCIALFEGQGHLVAQNRISTEAADGSANPVGIFLFADKQPLRTRVVGNVVTDRRQTPSLLPVAAVALTEVRDLEVDDNDVRGSFVWIIRGREVFVRRNRFDVRGVMVAPVQNPTVHDNAVEGPDQAGMLSIVDVEGTARVAHNRSSRLHVIPVRDGARELPYRAHVADNVVRVDAFVGDPACVPHADSRVQVLGNQAENLFVNAYAHMVTASNLAVVYAPVTLSNASQTIPIIVHNHNV